jgi:beta-phosphoglucomutase
MRPVAVLFDFDGVIVDSFEAHYSAWGDAFKQLFQYDIPEFPHASHQGKSPTLIAAYFCAQIDKSDQSKELFALKSKILHRGDYIPKLLPGVHEIQTWLTQQQIPYGIASNATKLFVGNSVKQLKINFETYLGLEDYTRPKPDPEPYLLLADKLQIPETDFKNTWVFEDSLTGTDAAKQAGLVPIGIMTQFSKSELISRGSKLVFKDLKEAYEYLKM